MPAPEALARQVIDRVLTAAGWIAQDMAALNFAAGKGVAVREFPLQGGNADYLLYVDGKVVGVVEAKKAGTTLTGVELQNERYGAGLPPGIPAAIRPLPHDLGQAGNRGLDA